MKCDTFANRKASKPTAIAAYRVSVGYVADTAVTLEVNTGDTATSAVDRISDGSA